MAVKVARTALRRHQHRRRRTGTFKDRYFLERDPHRFLEGGLTGAWVINAPDVYLYLSDEYAAGGHLAPIVRTGDPLPARR